MNLNEYLRRVTNRLMELMQIDILYFESGELAHKYYAKVKYFFAEDFSIDLAAEELQSFVRSLSN